MPDLNGNFQPGLTDPDLGFDTIDGKGGNLIDDMADAAAAFGPVDGAGAELKEPVTNNLNGLLTSGSGTGGAGKTYRMRARDTTLARIVFWDATIVDHSGAQYQGPGPLTDIVVWEVLG